MRKLAAYLFAGLIAFVGTLFAASSVGYIGVFLLQDAGLPNWLAFLLTLLGGLLFASLLVLLITTAMRLAGKLSLRNLLIVVNLLAVLLAVLTAYGGFSYGLIGLLGIALVYPPLGFTYSAAAIAWWYLMFPVPGERSLVVVAGHLIIEPEQRDAYLETIVPVVDLARQTPGCLDYALSPDPVDANRINVYKLWRNRSDLAAFRGSGPDDSITRFIRSVDVKEYMARKKAF